jgi:hypothetical protein
VIRFIYWKRCMCLVMHSLDLFDISGVYVLKVKPVHLSIILVAVVWVHISVVFVFVCISWNKYFLQKISCHFNIVYWYLRYSASKQFLSEKKKTFSSAAEILISLFSTKIRVKVHNWTCSFRLHAYNYCLVLKTVFHGFSDKSWLIVDGYFKNLDFSIYLNIIITNQI